MSAYDPKRTLPRTTMLFCAWEMQWSASS